MAVNFKLGAWRDVEDPSPLGRRHVGWKEGLSAQEVYEINRGVWNLGRRAKNERYATFSVDGKVIVVIAIKDIEDLPLRDGSVKQAVVGRVLEEGEPGYEQLIDRDVDSYRNPVTYLPDDAAGGPRACACRCGAEVTGGRAFLPGHDQKAIHERIRQGWGTTVAFIDWFDNQEWP